MRQRAGSFRQRSGLPGKLRAERMHWSDWGREACSVRRAEAAEPEDGETREGRAIVLKGQGCRDSLQMHRRKECVTEPRTPAQGPVSEGAARTGMRSHDLRGELASYMGPPANKHETLSLGLAGRDHAPRARPSLPSHSRVPSYLPPCCVHRASGKEGTGTAGGL